MKKKDITIEQFAMWSLALDDARRRGYNPAYTIRTWKELTKEEQQFYLDEAQVYMTPLRHLTGQ
jgi:hypothetical protein